MPQHKYSPCTAWPRRGSRFVKQQGLFRTTRVVIPIAVVMAMVLSHYGIPFALASQERPNIIVIFTDDLGYADIGVQGQVQDVRTPHLDRLADEGVRCTAGYITAPQCSPSRAGLITGRYQQRYGIDTIPDCPLPLDAVTIAERLKRAGYATGMVGKWHLNPNILSLRWARENLPDVQPENGRVQIPVRESLKFYPHRQGFDDYLVGEMHRYFTNFASAQSRSDNVRKANAKKREPVASEEAGFWITDDRYRLEIQSDAALDFLQRNRERPFFLYLCYFAPHVPLEATPEYLDRFPGEMAERRRHALAMISAVDDGVGRIMEALKQHNLDQQTLVIFTSDNGAPLKLTKEDARPVNVSSAAWDGSLNDPWVGEKGMLSEGGIRVPFLLRWPGTLPAGLVYSHGVSSLDIAATASAIAQQPLDPQLDGVNLIPYLTGDQQTEPHEALYWRFWNQAAIRSGKWKYLMLGTKAEFLFDLQSPEHEHKNVLAENDAVGDQLREQLQQWCNQLQPAGLPTGAPNVQEAAWYRFYFNVGE